MVMSADDYRKQAEGARRTSRQVLIYGGLSFVGGWLIVVGAIVAWLAFKQPLSDALDVLLVAGLGSVIGGVALYATSCNLAISASRLEIDAATKLRDEN
jgi:membrane protein YqaA with SNARE-associated domain